MLASFQQPPLAFASGSAPYRLEEAPAPTNFCIKIFSHSKTKAKRERERENQNLLEMIEIEGKELREVRLLSGGGGGGSEGERDEAQQRRWRRFLYCIFRVHFQRGSASIGEL